MKISRESLKGECLLDRDLVKVEIGLRERQKDPSKWDLDCERQNWSTSKASWIEELRFGVPKQ